MECWRAESTTYNSQVNLTPRHATHETAFVQHAMPAAPSCRLGRAALRSMQSVGVLTNGPVYFAGRPHHICARTAC
jgi:hypothetical protein